LKLLPEAEGEELPDDDDDDDTELPRRVDVDWPALDATEPETEPDLETSHEMQGQAITNTHEDGVDDAEDAELVEVTVAPMANGALVPITELTSLCRRD